MKNIMVLKNRIQEYAWGSRTAIPKLLGKKAVSKIPQAELWMGAHPKASSCVMVDGRWEPLNEIIDKYPEDILGKKTAEKFNNRLPYLFKVLTAAKPLSIQAHPDKRQAQDGFSRENKMGIPLDAPERNYKDDSHKPECICALTRFWALNGFRKIKEIIVLMEKVCSNGLKKECNTLKKMQDLYGLKKFFYELITMDHERKNRIIQEVVTCAKKLSEKDILFQWIIKLHDEYPSDIGILFPILLNLICLEPGEAMFLFAGALHVYLDGTGIELMANSDNVLRGGLTKKHIDVKELTKVLNYRQGEIKILRPQDSGIDCEKVYETYADEFILSVITIYDNIRYESPVNRGPEIILCIDGKGSILEGWSESVISLKKGDSFIIPASVEKYSVSGDATLYKAAVPV